MPEGLDIRIGIHLGRCPSGPGDDDLRRDRRPHAKCLEVDPVRLNEKRLCLPVPNGIHPTTSHPPRLDGHHETPRIPRSDQTLISVGYGPGSQPWMQKDPEFVAH